MKQKIKNDLIILVLWNIVAFILSFLIGKNYLITAFLFFVVPSLYISLKDKKIIKKSLLFSIYFSTPLIFIFDYLAHKDGAWQNYSLINTYILNTYPVDDFLWGFLYIYYIVIFYEYFFDKDRKGLPKIFYKLVKFFSFASILLLLFFIAFPKFYIPYIYIVCTIVFFIVLPYIIIKKYSKIAPKLLGFLIYFFYMFMLYEYVANIKDNWNFPGQHFIGQLQIFFIHIPLEEFLWALLAAPAIIVYYEFFADNRK